jgi:hypothetical protein
MGSLWKSEALRYSEQALDEPVQLLSANARLYGQGLPSSRDVEGRGAIK